MNHLRNLFLLLLLTGIVTVEVISNRSFALNSAQSQQQISRNEQAAFLSILQNGINANQPPTLQSQPFPHFSPPQNPSDISNDALRSYQLLSGSTNTTVNPGSTWYEPTYNTGVPLALYDTIPPSGTPLYYAYLEGGRFWYGKQNDVLVIFPDETIRSFNKKTGQATDWLQDKLAYPPIDDTEAYLNYQKNYRAEIVAQTSTYVLMEFPSGGVIKVAKPKTIPTTPLPTPPQSNSSATELLTPNPNS